MKKNLFLFVMIASALCINSCKKSSTPASILKTWTGVVLSTKNENPSPAGRTETGTVDIQLYSDNTVHYSATINNLLAGDAITAGHIHVGDPVSNGPIIVPFTVSFVTSGTTSTSSGTTSISSTLADSLLNQPISIYVNFHSTAFPGGLVRAQLDKTIDFAYDVAMVGAQENPAVVTTATGRATFRIMTDKSMYSKVTVTGLEANDTLTAAHIHQAATGVNGGVIQFFCANDTDFGITKYYTGLSDALILSIKTDPVYANAHSKRHLSGIIRGQIR